MMKAAIVLLSIAAVAAMETSYTGKGWCKRPIKKGDNVYLESAVLPGHFVGLKQGGSIDRGNPDAYGDLKHVTGGPIGLIPWQRKDRTRPAVLAMDFSEDGARTAASDDAALHSGDFVSLKQKDMKEGAGFAMDFNVAWPPMLGMAGNGASIGKKFQILAAQEVPVVTSKAEGLMRAGDSLEPEQMMICDGQAVFLRHEDQYPLDGVPGNGCTSGKCKLGQFLYMQANDDKHVGFWHHYPGFSGKKDDRVDLEEDAGWVADDSSATANKFYIRLK